MKKHSKRVLSLLLALTLCLGLLPGAALAADSDFTIENGVLIKYNGPGGDVVIPDTVTSISGGAFDEKSNVRKLTIPSTVNELGFGIVSNCDSLKEVVIPASVTKIDNWAFEYHYEGMAMNAAMSNLTIRGAAGSYAETWVNTAKIGAFKLCEDPYNYTFVADQGWSVAPEATKHNFIIENGVLKSYTGPGGDVVVPDSVTELNYGVFDGVGTLNSLTLPAGIKSVNISNPYVKHITVSDGTTQVSLKCDALESVTLPDSVTGLYMVSPNLRELTIPAGVTNWPYLACPQLRKLTFPTDNWVYKGISRADLIEKLKNSCPGLNEIVNCPNEFVDDLIAPAVAIRDNWTAPQRTLVPQSDRIIKLSNEITAGLTSDCDKAKAISQWVVDHIKYDDDYYYEGLKDYSDVPFDMDDVLDTGKAVCAGFARLTQALLVAQKIPCLYVLGKTKGGGHAWNLAYIDGEYLWIDNTWGMDYFGLGIYAISEDHEATGAAAFNGVRGPGEIISIQEESESKPEDTAKDKTETSVSPSVTGTAYTSTQTVMVDDQPVEFNAYALKDANGNMTNYVKLRDVAQVLNGSAAQFQVGWDGSISITTKQAYTANGSEMIQNFTGDQQYTVNTSPVKVNGQTADMEAITLTDATGGYTYFKLRDLGKALGFNVSWTDGKIIIDPNSPYSDAD